ncbi:hypothetical protein LshimejAT787_1003650 [Lyophyllum shimeji]|uniref:Uncharacterized protein n=1 Tax=Lyophyllum shimeji TaxID=47721 RepID=A0A9P3PTL1_LYOSH|nr:hypothetical protein LshimejAT787_1003650 [Lyophyllum shimeji]
MSPLQKFDLLSKTLVAIHGLSAIPVDMDRLRRLTNPAVRTKSRNPAPIPQPPYNLSNTGCLAAFEVFP